MCAKKFKVEKKIPKHYQSCFNDSKINYLNILEKRKDEYYWKSPKNIDKNNVFLL